MNSKPLRAKNQKSGFGAAVALILLSLTSLALALCVLGAAVVLGDMVFHREVRIQQSLYDKACTASAQLLKAKDVFATGTVKFKEFGCVVTL